MLEERVSKLEEMVRRLMSLPPIREAVADEVRKREEAESLPDTSQDPMPPEPSFTKDPAPVELSGNTG